eukprot:GHVP01061932.1.p1 GENE.GHVP01061932.1~~GHVP01061932.1.p1  ORF type:complete len:247 (+),score=45.25 GHVP01061932.1:57-743(+)
MPSDAQMVLPEPLDESDQFQYGQNKEIEKCIQRGFKCSDALKNAKTKLGTDQFLIRCYEEIKNFEGFSRVCSVDRALRFDVDFYAIYPRFDFVRKEEMTIDEQEVHFVIYKMKEQDYFVANVIVNGQPWFNIDHFGILTLVEDADPEIDKNLPWTKSVKALYNNWPIRKSDEIRVEELLKCDKKFKEAFEKAFGKQLIGLDVVLRDPHDTKNYTQVLNYWVVLFSNKA